MVEERLEGGNLNDVVRVGDTVRRSTGVWTGAVHALLGHLEAASYPAPRVLGVDGQGREILTFIRGVPVHPDHLDLLDDAGLRRVGALIHQFYEAQMTFHPPDDAVWSDLGRDPSGSTEVVAHNDLAPWNLIVGETWSFIDWDLAAPGRRDWDLAWALHSHVQLWPGTSTDPDRTVRRINAFLDGGRVPISHRRGLLGVVLERIDHHVQDMRRRASEGSHLHIGLVADGHADLWETASNHVAENLDRWTSLL